MTRNDTMQHYTTVYKTIQHYIRLYGTIRHYTTLYKTIQQYIRLYDTVRHYITLYKTIWHYARFYNTILHNRRLLYKTIQDYTRLYNVIQDYTTLYNTICHFDVFLRGWVNSYLPCACEQNLNIKSSIIFTFFFVNHNICQHWTCMHHSVMIFKRSIIINLLLISKHCQHLILIIG
jgi:hypothetical protein